MIETLWRSKVAYHGLAIIQTVNMMAMPQIRIRG